MPKTLRIRFPNGKLHTGPFDGGHLVVVCDLDYSGRKREREVEIDGILFTIANEPENGPKCVIQVEDE